jgi:hypothetical protein
VRGGDIQEYQFVCPLLRVVPRQFYRVAGIAQVNKVNALYSTAVFNVKTGDDAFS